MKIKKSLVEQIIREETEKLKKLIVLKEEKEQIVKQLNELYEENSETIEEESVLDLLPPEDKQVAIQDIQQTQVQPQALEEGSLTSGILGKIQNLILGIKQQDPQGVEQAASAMASKYRNKSFSEIYNDVKQMIQPEIAEGNKRVYSAGEVKEKVAKIASKIAGVTGGAAPLVYIVSAIWTAIQGTGMGIPTILGQTSMGLIISAVVSGVIYILANYSSEKN